MMFWIAIGVVFILAILVSIGHSDEYGWAVGSFLLTFVFGSLAAVLLVTVLFSAFPYTPIVVSSSTQTLTTLNTSTASQGTFFLGTGTVEGESVINYVTNENGVYRVQSVDADQATILTDSGEPTVIINVTQRENTAILPFRLPTLDTYEFHIPEGSITANYEVG
jgi:hypothetical protein